MIPERILTHSAMSEHKTAGANKKYFFSKNF